MHSNNRIYVYNRKLAFYLLPALILLGLIFFCIFAVFGLFFVIVLVTLAIGGFLIRLFSRSNKLKGRRFEDDGRTVVLDEEEYEVLEKKK